jgi:predicted nucleic acid-binding protein
MEKMEDTICLDSDILIDFLRNKKEIVEWINANKEKVIFATTIINIFELYSGAYNSKNPEKIKHLDEFLPNFKILGIDFNIAKRAGEECSHLNSQGKMIENSDLLIGIIALSKDCPIKTNNKKDFERIKGLKVM